MSATQPISPQANVLQVWLLLWRRRLRRLRPVWLCVRRQLYSCVRLRWFWPATAATAATTTTAKRVWPACSNSSLWCVASLQISISHPSKALLQAASVLQPEAHLASLIPPLVASLALADLLSKILASHSAAQVSEKTPATSIADYVQHQPRILLHSVLLHPHPPPPLARLLPLLSAAH